MSDNLVDILESFHSSKKSDAPEVPKTKIFEKPSVIDVPKTSLLEGVKIFMNSWPDQPGSVDVLRASGLHDICPRQFVMNYWQPRNSKRFDWKTHFMMSAGTGLHSYIQNYVLGPMGILSGNWWENGGGSSKCVPGFHPDPDRAIYEIQHQQELTWSYIEPTVWHPNLRISGHLDGMVSKDRLRQLVSDKSLWAIDLKKAIKNVEAIPAGELTPFELKTTGSRSFMGMDHPDDVAIYYQTQAVVYQRLTNTRETLFWYLNRDDFSGKAFIFPHNDDIWDSVIAKAKIIWEAIRDETLPDSMKKCLMYTDPRAKTCSHREECWMSEKKLNWPNFIATAKANAEVSGRSFLDFKGWRYDPTAF